MYPVNNGLFSVQKAGFFSLRNMSAWRFLNICDHSSAG